MAEIPENIALRILGWLYLHYKSLDYACLEKPGNRGMNYEGSMCTGY